MAAQSSSRPHALLLGKYLVTFVLFIVFQAVPNDRQPDPDMMPAQQLFRPIMDPGFWAHC